MENQKRALPELLAPAGDMSALKSAIASGADAVYFGADLFNARIRANNFNLDEAREAIRLCHAHGVKAFVTLNIAIYDKELPQMLEYVKSLYESGADALIVADLGAMRLIKKYFPDLEIHASTQAGANSLDGVKALSELGCKRVVVARELDKKNLEYICKGTDTEIEAFVHGAHCMSISGQCLMSYAMGGRSGNRGECAQPCRLPYTIAGKEMYPLSLKDMSLANHIEELLTLGVSSLKIEGRMKSADYVGGAVEIWRRLLDSGKSATQGDMQSLSRLFSRQGFTDGYFASRISKDMLGVRSEQDKAQTKEQIQSVQELTKPPLNISASFILGKGATITVSDKHRSVSVYADIVEEAKTSPMSREDIEKSLSKLGSTPYSLGKIEIEKSDNIMVRVSSLNALRREAIDKLLGTNRRAGTIDYVAEKRAKKGDIIRSAVFYNPNQIPENAEEYFDRIYLPFYMFDYDSCANGIYLPPAILDDDLDEVRQIVRSTRKLGARYVLVSNIGQIKMVKELGMVPVADFRFNVFNGHTIDALCELGVRDVILSPELTLPQCRDMAGYSVVAYGKIPIMTTFKCIMKDATGCGKCSGYITDRTGATMYCQSEYGHHTIIHNSVPIYMADKAEQIASHSWHFIFTDETADECYDIIEAYRNGAPTQKKIRRIRS
ncbi:MAG: U32 family peptidase [Clostridia bacterium]|nr:U32 family peptidase [Clostridia bacterium]